MPIGRTISLLIVFPLILCACDVHRSVSEKELYGKWICPSTITSSLKIEFTLYKNRRFDFYSGVKRFENHFRGSFYFVPETDMLSLDFRPSLDQMQTILVENKNLIQYDEISQCNKS